MRMVFGSIDSITDLFPSRFETAIGGGTAQIKPPAAAAGPA
jgi:hypothetical protein